MEGQFGYLKYILRIVQGQILGKQTIDLKSSTAPDILQVLQFKRTTYQIRLIVFEPKTNSNQNNLIIFY